MQDKNDDPDLFHVLHVEDETTWAEVKDGKYEGGIKSTVEGALSKHKVRANDINWVVTRSSREAIEEMSRAEQRRPGRGFDAVFCDLLIYGDRPGDPLDTENGLRVLRALRTHEWPGAVVVVSSFADAGALIERKEVLRSELRLDEWLDKNRDFSAGAQSVSTIAKLQRCIVPIHTYERQCRRFNPPSIFLNRRTRRLLRELVVLSRAAVASDGDPAGWPLTRILLLGEPGSGKGMLARTFDKLLPANEKRKKMITVNCASLVSEGGSHGGSIRLFGAHGFQHLEPRPGVFEQATSYRDPGKPGLPPQSDRINWSEAGVVFLDEFVELEKKLQAAILNSLEEGVVHRDGTGHPVPIGCHIVFATNAEPDEMLRDGRVRDDLLDRIPHVLSVPPLRDRCEEIEPMLEAFAARKQALVSGKKLPVQLSESAKAVVRRAVSSGIISSVRQLQTVADLQPGENSITDGNLTPLFAKAALLGVTDLLTQPAAALSLARKAEMLGLPEELCVDELPRGTEWAIGELYGRKCGELQVRGKEKAGADEDSWSRFLLMSGLVRPDDARRLYVASATIDARSAERAANAVRAQRVRAAHRQGVDLSGNDAAKRDALVAFLLADSKKAS